MDYPPRKSPILTREARIRLRKQARTRLYAVLYGPCASGVPHNNIPWTDANRRGANLPSKAEFTVLTKESNFNPIQLSRVNARFAELGGTP